LILDILWQLIKNKYILDWHTFLLTLVGNNDLDPSLVSDFPLSFSSDLSDFLLPKNPDLDFSVI
jgi:hypothetical protein